MMPFTERTLDSMSPDARGLFMALATLAHRALLTDPRDSDLPEVRELRECLAELGDAVIPLGTTVELSSVPGLFKLLHVSKDGSCSVEAPGGGGFISTMERLKVKR